METRSKMEGFPKTRGKKIFCINTLIQSFFEKNQVSDNEVYLSYEENPTLNYNAAKLLEEYSTHLKRQIRSP